MQILKSIHSAATSSQKRFVLIGGHALNIHGLMRATGDVDIMVEAQDAVFWRELLQKLGYEIFHESSAFMQSKPKELAAWPIDLMLVDANTISKALSDATTTEVFGPPLRVASVASLMAMKLHALRFVDAVRALKDQSDLFGLLELAGMTVHSEPFRQMCEQYGTIEIYERLTAIKKS
jgi:hypothetical protein